MLRFLRQNWLSILIVGLLIYLVARLLWRPSQVLTLDNPRIEGELRLVTLLARDAIPAIDAPEFYSADEADREYGPDELVLGVVMEGESRAYSTDLLDRHEIVNDAIAGHPIAVTW